MFDYAEAMRRLIDDVVQTCDAFGHIKVSGLLVGCVKARNSDGAGLYARTIPLRFEGGALTTLKRGSKFSIPIVRHGEHEALYIVSFVLPRFHNMPFDDKLMTVFHELYHVGPNFDGDIRRFQGSNYIHSSSQEKYDTLMRQLAQQYVQRTKQPELHEFLKLSYAQILGKYGGIRMRIYKAPKPQLIRDTSAKPLTVEMKETKKGKHT